MHLHATDRRASAAGRRALMTSRVRRDPTIVPCNIPPRCVKPVRSSSCSSGSSPWRSISCPGSSFPTRRVPTARGVRSSRSSGSTSRAASAPNTRRCPSRARSRPPADMAVIKDIVERRVNTTGVSEPVVTTQGKDRVVVELPGVTDPEAIRQLIGQTGRLDFVPLGSTQAHDRTRSSTRSSTHRCSVATRSPRRPSAPTRTADRLSTSCSRTTARTSSPTTPPRTSAPTSRSRSTTPSSPRRSSRTRSRAATSRSPAGASPGSAPRTRPSSSRSSSSDRCRSRSSPCRARRSAPRSARSS